MKQKQGRIHHRVDFQVLAIVLLYTFISIILTSQIYWKYTFDVLMGTHANQVYSLYHAVEAKLDPDTFLLINSPEDMGTDLYIDAVNTLLDLKLSSGVLYLYTAKVNEEGQFVYVIDGLEEHLDFRVPNAPIEPEIIFKMEQALSGVESMPQKILHTEWGEIFMAYLPFHDQQNNILGVVGIEFDASESYQTYTDLKVATLYMCIFLLISAAFLAYYVFRRITNPLYLDKHTKDTPTGMRNRNAYEVDLNNLNARGHFQNIGVIVADINGLKEVNDRLGHQAGDKYISLVAESIHLTKPDSMVGYRTGGDEFVIFVESATIEDLERFVDICSSRVRSQKLYSDMRCSVACGFSIFDETQDKNLLDTLERADQTMYQEKRRQKESKER